MIKGNPQVRSFIGGFPLKVSIYLILIVSIFLLSGNIVFAINLGLIEPHLLKRELSEWVILDARPRSEWLAGHIPGALSFSWEDYTRTDKNGVPYRVWAPHELAKALGEMGIDENTPIIVYGDADKSWGGEGWNCWVLAWIGHKAPIRLLAGGIQSWRSNNYLLKEGVEKLNIHPVQYKLKLEPYLSISTEELEKQKSNLVLVDTRSTLELLKGRIPGAIHIKWQDFYTGKDRHPLAPDAVKKLLKKHDVNLNKLIVYYCTGGIRSAYAWLVHQLAGLPPARNYEGGFEAWEKR
jgi:thiosulfate/3-mercaptopyruvate sulfurtransferase